MTHLTLPDGHKVELAEITRRQLIVPTGATIRVPEGQTWILLAMAALPRPTYAPPGTEARDIDFWGDVRIVVDGVGTYYRTSALTLMDRYWGRYNLNPELPEVTARLEQAQHAVQTAPRIPDLAIALEHALEMTRAYLSAASPAFDEIVVVGGRSFSVEHLDCAQTADGETHAEDEVLRKPGCLDVELLLMVKRPVN